MVKLRYVGDGAWVPNVPAADHDQPDDGLAAALVAGGLYERAETAKAPKATIVPPADEAAADGEGKAS
jgi:hypothetical protein